MKLSSFELSDMQVVFPNDSTAVLTYHVKQKVTPRGKDESTVQEMNDTSTWIKVGDDWQCVIHTETPAGGEQRSTDRRGRRSGVGAPALSPAQDRSRYPGDAADEYRPGKQVRDGDDCGAYRLATALTECRLAESPIVPQNEPP